MKSIYYLILLAVLLLAGTHTAFPQDAISPGIKSNYANAPAASPNAGALRNTDVDLFHGNLSVSIPLYTVKSKFLSVPISLQYSVPQESSLEIFHPGWTGLGWRLSAGGAITRTSRGEPDEHVYHVGNTFWPPRVSGESDPEDQFHFNFCGYSGSFFYYQGRLILDNQGDILTVLPVATSEGLTGFTIQTAEGNLYTFGYGAVPSNPERNTVEWSRTVKGQGHSPYQNRCITTWYLSSIESPEGDRIFFNYEQEAEICILSEQKNWSRITAVYKEGETQKGTYTRATEDMEERVVTFVTPSFLKSITSEGTVDVEFIRAVATEKNYPPKYTVATDTTWHFNAGDLQTIAAAKWHKLASIRLRDKTNGNRLFKRFDLTYRETTTDVLKLTGIRETGIAPDNTQASLPAYTFTYALQLGTGVEALQKMVYPTGGYDLYTYGKHKYMDQTSVTEFGASGVRIETIKSYPSAGEEPWVTEYYYLQPSGSIPGHVTSGVIGRKKNHLKTVIFPAMTGLVEWKKEADYDMSNAFLCAPQGGQVGYSSVFVRKNRGNEYGDYHHYTFRNYDPYTDNNGQRFTYERVGQLLSVATSIEKTEYEYNYPGEEIPTDTIFYTYDEYMPFSYQSEYGGTRGVYSRLHTWNFRFFHRRMKPCRIIQYVPGANDDTLQVTTLVYNPQTLNLISSETVNKKENTTYRTEYFYPHNDLHYSPRKVNVPYEVVQWRDGKVMGAEVTDFVSRVAESSGYRTFEAPSKKYVQSRAVPVSRYNYSSYNDGNVLKRDSWLQTIEYEYYDNHLLKTETSRGQLPTTYEWDDFYRVKSVSVGDMKTEYTYNVHGVTQVRQANGTTQSTEYNSLGQPVLVRDTDGNILQKIDYSYNLNP